MLFTSKEEKVELHIFSISYIRWFRVSRPPERSHVPRTFHPWTKALRLVHPLAVYANYLLVIRLPLLDIRGWIRWNGFGGEEDS